MHYINTIDSTVPPPATHPLTVQPRTPPATHTAAREAAERAAQSELGVSRRRVEELEAELSQLRASSKVLQLFTLPSKEDVLAGLGLEMWKDDRLRWKAEADVETQPVAMPRRCVCGGGGRWVSGCTKVGCCVEGPCLRPSPGSYCQGL